MSWDNDPDLSGSLSCLDREIFPRARRANTGRAIFLTRKRFLSGRFAMKSVPEELSHCEGRRVPGFVPSSSQPENIQPTLPPSAFPDLTEREREILGLIALGKSNAHIAEELVLSPKTVSNHVSNIFSKLQVVDRAQAVLRAKQAGLG